MGMHSIASAFAAAARGNLRLVNASLIYRDNRQVLTATGFHVDGTPFAFVSAPFDGNPNERAGQAARDIVQAHTGTARSLGDTAGTRGPAAGSLPLTLGPQPFRRDHAMSQKGSGLARLMGGLRTLDSDADALASRLEAALGNLSTEMATTQQIVGNVESSVEDLHVVNALYSNGAPNPTPGSQGPSQS